jgi:hypothetical protein
MATSGKAWREKRVRGVEVQLPSSNVAILRPVSIEAFVNLPNIPDTLTPVIHQLATGKEFVPENFDDAMKLRAVLKELCRYCFVSPHVVDAPTEADDEVWIGDVDTDDQIFVLHLVDKTAEYLRSFRPRPDEAVEPVLPEPADEDTAVEVAESPAA